MSTCRIDTEKMAFRCSGCRSTIRCRLIRPYVADLKINYPVLQGLGHKDEIAAAFGPFRGVPTTFIISREGKLCAKHIGATERAGYEAQVKGLLPVF